MFRAPEESLLHWRVNGRVQTRVEGTVTGMRKRGPREWTGVEEAFTLGLAHWLPLLNLQEQWAGLGVSVGVAPVSCDHLPWLALRPGLTHHCTFYGKHSKLQCCG